MLTIEICCQVLRQPVYFCDGVTTPLLGYDVVAAASLVIDTEARQVWSKHTVQYGHTEQFTPPITEPSTAANPATVRRSSTTASTTVNSTATDPLTVCSASTPKSTTAHSIAINPSFVRRSSTTTTTTADPSTTTPSATASTTRDTSTTPLETVRLPSCESSRPSHYCFAASTSSSASTKLDDSAHTTATVTPTSNSTDSTYLDPRAPMFTPRFESTLPSTATHPSMFVLQPVDSTSTTDPHPYAVDGDMPRCDEFSRRRPPEFELDGET